MTRLLSTFFPLFFKPKGELSAVQVMSSDAPLIVKSGVGANIIEGKYIQGEYLWRTSFFALLVVSIVWVSFDRWTLHDAIRTGGNHTFAVPTDKNGAAVAPAQELPVAPDASTAEKHRIIAELFKSGIRGGPDGTVVADDQATRDALCEKSACDFFASWYDRNNGQNAQIRRNPLHAINIRIGNVGHGDTNTYDIGLTVQETDAATGRVVRSEDHSFTVITGTDAARVTRENGWGVVVTSISEDDRSQ
jgi:hypothetical protein